MSLDTTEKQQLINTHQTHATDTGSAEVQVAMLSERISKLKNDPICGQVDAGQLPNLKVATKSVESISRVLQRIFAEGLEFGVRKF